jgi:HAE1 family hydrophobic/amphiphilic exporter-1
VSLSLLFIQRPVMTTLVMVAILLSGIIGYTTLPLNALPNVDFPTLVVTAQLPGGSPETMASAVATPLEKQFSTIAGIEAMNSNSALGQSQITLQFDLSRNIDAAAQDVQSAITQAAPLLPHDMPSPPSFQKVNPANNPVLYLAVYSDSLPLWSSDEYAETYIAQHISMVGGVAQVQVYGQQKYAVRMQVDPRLLAVHKLGIDEVATAISNANVKEPTGTLYGRHQAFNVQSNDQLLDANAYKSLIVSYRNGSPVRMEDIAQCVDSVQNDKLAGWLNDKRAIILAVQRQPGTNTVQVVESIKKVLPDLQTKLPTSCKVQILYDLSQSVRDSVKDVELTLIMTVVLVVFVIFLFLRNFSATVIPSLALPMSVIGTFAGMSLLGFSLNNLTLMALTLSVGFVVDDAIVVLENIVRHMEMGKTPYEAAIVGSREIGFTVLSMTLSLVAVFIPVLFMQGIIGRLFKEFAVTISVAILISGFISLSLTPMLCSRFLKPVKLQERGALYRWSEGIVSGLVAGYELLLRMVLRLKLLTLLISFLLIAATGYLFIIIPKGFMPLEDQGQLIGFTEAAQSVSFDDMVAHQKALASIVARDPNIESFISTVGSGGASPTGNAGSIVMYLQPRSKRKLTAEQIMNELRPKLETVQGIRVYLENPPVVNIGGQLTKSLYQLTLQSTSTENLYRWTRRLEKKLQKMAQLQDVTSDLQLNSPQVNIDVDRDKASMLGVTAQQVDDALGYAYGTRQVSTIYTPSNEYWVIIEVQPKYYNNPNLLSLLYVRSSAGKLVPLDTIASFKRDVTPLLINHLGQLPSTTISFNLAPGASLGEAMDSIDTVVKQELPPNITTTYQGSAQAFQSSLVGLGALLILAIIVIYIVLGILYESFIHPLTILAGLPSAGLGALATLMIFHVDLNIYAFLGLIMLIGIVKKNAIMMVDFAVDAQREKGMSAEDAIFEACLVRFRPIMMTTMAALMGSLPIAIGFGAGAESRQPLGLTVVGGLLVSQLLTLFITPVVHIYLDKLAPGKEKRSKVLSQATQRATERNFTP